MRRGWVLLLMLAGWCSVPGRAQAVDHHCLWAIRGSHNTLYLFGSVHVLKPEDSTLPAVAERAYAASHTLVFELDPDAALADLGAAGALLRSAMSEQSLADSAGASLYARVRARSAKIELDPDLIEHVQPWFAAMLLEQAALAHEGYDADDGVDLQLAHRASQDHKDLIALETASQQLGIFAALDRAGQRDFLRQTLDELDKGDSELTATVRAWQHGDVAELSRLLREAQADSPALFRALTVDRNRRWLPKLLELLHGDQDVMVVVGALHLVGSEGLVSLLQHAGYAPVQQ